MKRVSRALLIFALLLSIGVGCRRRSSEARPPYPVMNELDYVKIFPYDDDILLRKLKRPIVVGGPNPLPPEADDPDVLIDWAPNTDAAIKTAVGNTRKKRDNENKNAQMQEIGAAYIVFCDNTPEPNRSLINFLQELRRLGKNNLRKLVEDKVIDVVMEANVNVPDEIVAFRKIDVEPGILTLQTKVSINLQLPEAVRKGLQQLTNAPASPEKLAKRIQEQQLGLVKTAYDEFNSQTAKAPEQRNPEKLQRFIETHSTPKLAEMVKTKAFKLSDPRGANDWVACLSGAESKEKGHLGIRNNGSFGFVSSKEVHAIFAAKE